ncbi:Uncharacterised protein [Legionella beliardensis]|uniref:Uncharacterized protein n=2 Tax=Legionella beliardensis TaxID=91822 RepID=A0A378I1G2_9GAMM|nr:Uncharacterised protein [Legionella beliardensis]
MASPSEHIAKQITLDKASTLRKLLESVTNNAQVSALLLGEAHDTSPTTAAMLANIDVLSQSKRPVVFVLESFKQYHNPKLQAAFKKAEKGSPKPLKGFKRSEEDSDVALFTFVLAAINHGIPVLGAENIVSNPFSAPDKKWSDLTAKIRAMEGFKKSPDRITKPNEVFSSLINEQCEEGAFCIFIGGAAHPPQLVESNGQIFDIGMQARVPNSVSVYLLRDDEPDCKKDAPYFSTERQLGGNYDFLVTTNKSALYKDSFDSQNQMIDKVNLLVSFIDDLLKGYSQFHKPTLGVFLQQEIAAVLSSFQQSVKSEIKFTELNKLTTNLIAATAKKGEGSKFSFFKKESYSSHNLAEAIHRDLADMTKQETTKQIDI